MMVKSRKGDDLSFHLEALKEVSQQERELFRSPAEWIALYVVFDLIRMVVTCQYDLLHASVCEEFEGIFD